jgi:hypothetical protein
VARPADPLQSDKSNTLHLTTTGTGDLADLASHLEPQRASFAYAKVKYHNDEHSFREKFILVIWIGEEVKVMRRARVSREHLPRLRRGWRTKERDVESGS